MSEELIRIANEADLIVNGYAFTRKEMGIAVLNLNHPDKAVLLSETGDILETSMDDIELTIVQGYLAKNLKYMEA